MKKCALVKIVYGLILMTTVLMLLTAASAEEAKKRSGDYQYEFVTENTVRIVKMKESAKEGVVVLPSDLDGYKVTHIGESLFEGCETIESVVIPNTVEYIEDRVFYFSSIRYVEIPDSVKSIGKYAFSYTQITSLVIPDSVTYVGEDAFNSCNYLSSVQLGNGLTELPSGMFGFCGLKNINLPDCITSIDDYCFVYTDMETVVIPESCNVIGAHAFSDCHSLSTLTLKNGVKEIGSAAFMNCNLTDIFLPASVKKIGSSAFDYQKLMNIQVSPDNPVIYIRDGYLFRDDNVIIAVLFNMNPSQCTIQGNSYSIVLPEYVNGLEDNLFTESDNPYMHLTSIVLSPSITVLPIFLFRQCRDLESVIIPEGVTKIEAWAFDYCESLEEIILPQSLKSIGGYAFSECKSLKSIIIPKNVEVLSINGMFSGCTSLETVVIEGKINEIPATCFSRCTKLKEIILPDTVANIDYAAFHDCTALEHIDLPSGIKTIDREAFEGCTRLSSITLPNTIKVIGTEAFASCTALKEIYIPASVTKLGRDIFQGCDGITIYLVEGSPAEDIAWEYDWNYQYYQDNTSDM